MAPGSSRITRFLIASQSRQKFVLQLVGFLSLASFNIGTTLFPYAFEVRAELFEGRRKCLHLRPR